MDDEEARQDSRFRSENEPLLCSSYEQRHGDWLSNRGVSRDSQNSDGNQSRHGHHVQTSAIVAVFVVAFDIKAGNIIEWCAPEEMDFEQVEFKAMASGFHKLAQDFVYFKKGKYFGLACFENMKVASELERGARMKSVGVLATSYVFLYQHMSFLESQVKYLLRNPGQYGALHEYWEKHKGLLDMTDSSIVRQHSSSQNFLTHPHLHTDMMQITHPAGCFGQFLQFFDVNIFIIWKLALLQKRILFFSPPPIGVVCYRVYCACCLAKHSLQGTFPNRDTQPHFYVNVADIDVLESELSYIACTTEKVFEDKTSLFDVYVDNQNIECASPALRDICKSNAADRQRLNKLNVFRSSYPYEDGETDENMIFIRYFEELNRKIFQTLLDISEGDDKSLEADHIKNLGFDPKADRTFLICLAETYGVDVNVDLENPCCPKF